MTRHETRDETAEERLLSLVEPKGQGWAGQTGKTDLADFWKSCHAGQSRETDAH